MKIRLGIQKIYSLIIVYMLSFLAFLNLGNEILNLIGMHIIWDTVILYGLLIVSVFVGMVLCIIDHRRVVVDVLLIICFFVVTFIASILLNPQNTVYLFTSWTDYSTNPLYVIFIYSLPGYIFIRKIKQYDYLIHYMKIFSYIVVVMAIIVFFFSRESSAAQYMTFSYNMLTHLFYLIVYPPNKNKMVHYCIVIIGGFVFLFGGARGAAISLLIAWIIYYLLSYETAKRTVYRISLISIGVVFFVVLKNQILYFFIELLERFNINSRTIYMIVNGEVLSDSNRQGLYRLTLDNIELFGKGFMGDRVLLNIYPHNLFLEVLIQFGWVIGLLICSIICLCIVSGLHKKKKDEFILICLLLPCGFLKLLLTGSYLNQEPAFYILLGLCVNSIMRKDKVCEY